MSEKVRVAVLGMGWWSDVLADGVMRGDSLEIAACFTRSEASVTSRTTFAPWITRARPVASAARTCTSAL